MVGRSEKKNIMNYLTDCAVIMFLLICKCHDNELVLLEMLWILSCADIAIIEIVALCAVVSIIPDAECLPATITAAGCRLECLAVLFVEEGRRRDTPGMEGMSVDSSTIKAV